MSFFSKISDFFSSKTSQEKVSDAKVGSGAQDSSLSGSNDIRKLMADNDLIMAGFKELTNQMKGDTFDEAWVNRIRKEGSGR